MTTSKETHNLRKTIAILRVVLGVILLVTWWENLQKGLYQADNFAGFINSLANGHPVAFYRAFLSGVVAPNAALFGTFQLITELGMGVALVLGLFTPLAGLGAIVFFFNLFMAYLNPNPGDWARSLVET
ncbi:MAG: DoxX family membrane protein, partial [Anaerolineae bacterium]